MSDTRLENSLRRSIKGGVEQVQFNELSDMLQSVSLMPYSDRWVWSLEGSGEFSGASIRKIIDDNRLLTVDTRTLWIKYVPIKSTPNAPLLLVTVGGGGVEMVTGCLSHGSKGDTATAWQQGVVSDLVKMRVAMMDVDGGRLMLGMVVMGWCRQWHGESDDDDDGRGGVDGWCWWIGAVRRGWWPIMGLEVVDLVWLPEFSPERMEAPESVVDGKVMTWDKIAKWGSYDMNACTLCKENDESHDHLFFKCNFSQTIWRKLKPLMQFKSNADKWNDIIEELAEKPNNNSIWSIVRRLCLAVRLGLMGLNVKNSMAVQQAAIKWNVDLKYQGKMSIGAAELCGFLNLRNIRRGLITRNVKLAVDLFHERFGMSFSPALSREFRPYKPDPGPLLHICSTWGVEPNEVMMIGDSLKDD
nr:haloacid dehalogenase-like hydrolase domain-containing protein At2g33255 [Tanacetum cinerariifolium]